MHLLYQIPVLFFLASHLVVTAALGRPLSQAHAHNDYQHSEPLLNALTHGFTSIEADIHLVGENILVGHDPEDLRPSKTLAALYLEPLQTLAQGRRSIFDSGETITLLIDIKTDGPSTYAALKPLLAGYRQMLTEFGLDKVKTNAVTVILSGNRPREILLNEATRLAAFDGRLADLGHGLPIHFMPLVSDNWNNHFEWRGDGPFPDGERTRLRELVQSAHKENRRLRFWATPDKVEAWAELRSAKVDLINTDKLAELARFLKSGS